MRVVGAARFETLFEGLAREIAGWRARGSDPIRVVTPNELLREEARQRLERYLPDLNGISLQTITEWTTLASREQARELGLARLSGPAWEVLVWQIREKLAAASLPAMREPRLASAVESLLEARRTPEELEEELFRTEDLSSRVLLEATREFLRMRSRQKLLDPAREMELAAERILGGTKRSPILFFGFHALTALRVELVRACQAVRPTVLFVPGPEGAGEKAAEDLLQTARTLGAEIVLLKEPARRTLSVRAERSNLLTLEDPGRERLELATHATESAEVRGIAREIRREVEEKGRAFGEVLVTVGSCGPRAALFRRIFDKTQIPLLDCIGIARSDTLDGRRLLAIVRALTAGETGREAEALAFVAKAERAAAIVPLRRDETLRWQEVLDLLREHYFALFDAELPWETQSALRSLSVVLNENLRAKEVRTALEIFLRSPVELGPLRAEDFRSHVLLVGFEDAAGLERPVVFHAGLIDRALPLAGVARPRNLLLARFAFESSSERAVLSWAERERIYAPARNPAGLFVDIASQRAGRPLEAGSPEFRSALAESPPNRALEVPVDRTDLELATFLGERAPRETDLRRLRVYPGGEFLTRALRASEARWRKGALTSYDGVLEESETCAAVRSRAGASGRAWSATELETLANCPFAFLIEHVLKLIPPPEPGPDFSASERGLLFHELHESIGIALRNEGLFPLSFERLPRAISILDEIVSVKARALSREAPARRSHRRATLAALRDDLAASLAHAALDAEHRTPINFELRFGFPGAPDTARFDLGEGDELPLRGRFDRVDRVGDAVEVVDLKTGPPRSSKTLVSERNGRAEVSLQLPLYLEAAAQLFGKPVQAARFAHETIDHDFRELVYVRSDLERDREGLRALLSHLLELVHEGFFPCRPGASCCRARLAPACGSSPAERFARKQSDPRLAEHVRLLLALARPSPKESAKAVSELE